jgi:monoamine oxidase
MRLIFSIIFFIVGCMSLQAETGTQTRVAVVGAGLAGLTAAYRLQQQGLHVEIFEARDRPGGRAYTYYPNDISYEDLGGQFLNSGNDDPCISGLLQELEVSVENRALTFSWLAYQEGAVLDVFPFFLEGPLPSDDNFLLLSQKAEECANLAEILDWFFSEHPVIKKVLDLQMTGFEGSSSQYLGANYYQLMWDFYQLFYDRAQKKKAGEETVFEHRFIEGGTSRLIQALCQKLRGTIHYCSPVSRIFEQGHQIGIEVVDHRPVLFDKVILAVPSAVLKDITIDDLLVPRSQLEEMRSLQYGTVGKIIVPIRGIPHANFAYGPDFVVWFNRDCTLMTWYCGGESGIFDPSQEGAFANKMDVYSKIAKELFPSIDIVGDPVLACWTLDPYSKGSYSNFGAGQYAKFNEMIEFYGETVKKVFQPSLGKVFFAGEQTALKHFATLEGAVESGERASRMVLRSLH